MKGKFNLASLLKPKKTMHDNIVPYQKDEDA